MKYFVLIELMPQLVWKQFDFYSVINVPKYCKKGEDG